MKTKTNLMIICLLAMLMTNANIKTTAQIVYTDITDTTIFLPNTPTSNYYDFDLDNNGIKDFKFKISNIDTIVSGNLYIGEAFSIKIVSTLNKVAGGCFAYEDNALQLGDTINNKLAWSNFRYLKYFQNGVPWTCHLPAGDIFFGLKLALNSDTLYGWVRCSATDSSITIKDYAYNSSSNTYILAGQTIVGVDIDSLNALINIFAANGTLTVDFNGYQPAQGNIIILNIAGQVIKSSPINGVHNLIPLNAMSSGIYIVRIEMPEIVINKKMYLQSN